MRDFRMLEAIHNLTLKVVIKMSYQQKMQKNNLCSSFFELALDFLLRNAICEKFRPLQMFAFVVFI